MLLIVDKLVIFNDRLATITTFDFLVYYIKIHDYVECSRKAIFDCVRIIMLVKDPVIPHDGFRAAFYTNPNICKSIPVIRMRNLVSNYFSSQIGVI
ncbi:hypothetical protein CCR96_14215 [Halochromatium roseum]|nr:hypothetical protein [Halochromatium roseum]